MFLIVPVLFSTMKKVNNEFEILFLLKVLNVSVLRSLFTPASLNQKHFSLSRRGYVTSGVHCNKRGAILKQP